jgi:Transposase DDE domain
MIDYDTLFCFVDDFCKAFEGWWKDKLLAGVCVKQRRRRSTHLSLSESLTIMIAYHESGYRCFKDYYRFVLVYHRSEFPRLVSYERFVALMKRSLPVVVMLFAALRGEATDILFADSTPYAVCKAVRRYTHKVFEGLAALSKNSVGWFYGLKLHFVFNDKGSIVRLSITPGNVDDRKGLKGILSGLTGKIFGDRGYLGKDFFEDLWKQGIQMVTRLRKNMKNKLMNLWDRFYLDKRMTVESIFSSLKSCGTFEHSRHRNVCNAFCHIFTALIAYQIRPSKPTFKDNLKEINR